MSTKPTQVNGPTVIPAQQVGRRKFRYEATANGVTASVSTRSVQTIRAEPVTINGRAGLVFKDARGDIIRYVFKSQ